MSDDDGPPATTTVRGIPQEVTTHVNDLEPCQWRKVFKSSGSLRAWSVKPEDQEDQDANDDGLDKDFTLQRAPRSALDLIQDQEPRTEVNDDGHIEFQETTTKLSTELARKGFTKWGINASLAGGAYSITAGVGVDFSRAQEKTYSEGHEQAASVIHCSYIFPRADVHLDPDRFELSKDCKEFIKENRMVDEETGSKQLLQRFFNEFGGMLVTEFCLGGRLHCAEEVLRESKSAKVGIKKDMKFAITGNLMTPFGGGGAGYNREQGEEGGSTKSKSLERRSISIDCHGGNSLLSWSPSDWAWSLSSYTYWRVIKQNKAEDLIPFLTKVAAGACAKLEASPGATHEEKEHMAKLKDETEKLKNYMLKLDVKHQAAKNALSDEHKAAAQKMQKEEEEENFEVVVGNTYRYLRPRERWLENDPHRFACYVRVSDPKKVDRVEYTLHPEFGRAIPTGVESPHFMMRERDAYKPSIVHAKIVLKSDFEFRKRAPATMQTSTGSAHHSGAQASANVGEPSETIAWVLVFEGVGRESVSQHFKIGPRRTSNSQ